MATTTARSDLPTITNIIAELNAIPEQDRQRLSHASRLKLDSAEAELRQLLKALTTPP
jgi:hypothetical protein